jgi:hypothetical protein
MESAYSEYDMTAPYPWPKKTKATILANPLTLLVQASALSRRSFRSPRVRAFDRMARDLFILLPLALFWIIAWGTGRTVLWVAAGFLGRNKLDA